MATATQYRGPLGHFLLGSLAEYWRDPLGFVTRCAREYGDVVRVRFLNARGYQIYHPDHIEEVLAARAHDFVKPALLRRSRFMRRLLGGGLLTSEGEAWLRSRRLIQPAFHRERLDAYGAAMVSIAERALDAWRPGETRDVHRDMMRLTLEAVAKVLFDADLAGEARGVGAALERVLGRVAPNDPWWYVDNVLPTPGWLRFERDVRRLDAVVRGVIRGRRGAGGRDRGDLLSELIRARDEDGGGLSDGQLRDEVMTIMLAGHETTALALSWAWYLLARNPGAEAKLHAELDEVLGGSRAPGVADLPRLAYAEWVVKESLRLYPPAWAVGREAARETEVGGRRVRRGEQVYVFQWVTHRDARFFERPEEFLPERWAGGLEKRLPRFAYFPFGGGPRRCVGAGFAMTEAVLLLAAVARRFRLRLAPGAHDVTPLPTITLRPRGGIRVVVEGR